MFISCLCIADNTTVEKLRAICLDHAKLGESSLSPSLDSLFFGPSASQVLYLTEVCDTLLFFKNKNLQLFFFFFFLLSFQ